MKELNSSGAQRSARPIATVLLAMALLVAAVGPTLSSVEFGRTLENLNVATALEARRDGHWLVPTLEGMPRTKKPPLEAWVTALAMRPATVAACSSRDPAVRSAAFARLAAEARWPALLMAALAMLAVYQLGRVVAGERIGAVAAIIFGSSYLFLRYSQAAVTDVPLTLFVITANALFAAALFEGRVWLGWVGGGVALGLAFLSKGPVALVQTAAPVVAWAAWRRISNLRFEISDSRGPRRQGGAMLAGLMAFLAVGVPWYLLVLLRDPARQWHTWFREVSGSDAPDRVDRWYSYARYGLIMLFPWILFWIGGAWMTAMEAVGRRHGPTRRGELAERWVYVLFLVIVPVVVMTFFKDRKERYVLPMAGPAAVLAARCVMAYLAERPAKMRKDWVAWVHWGVLAIVGVGLPMLGTMGIKGLRTVEGRPWYSLGYAAGAATLAGGLIVVGIVAWRRGGMALPTFLPMLVIGSAFMHGYAQTSSGRSGMRALAERVWAKYPDAQMYTSLPRGQRASVDLSIYMNRVTGWITESQMRQPAAAGVARARAQVVLVKQREREAAPAPPEGWEELMVLPKGEEGAWRAWARAGAGSD